MTIAEPAAAATLTRDELYAQVWTTPILQLAKRYGLSDVGLAKACKRHQIPRPPVGYWAKKSVNKAPKPTPLSPLADPNLQVVVLTPQPKREVRPPAPGDVPAPLETPPGFKDPEIAAIHERFTQKVPNVSVPAALRAPLPIVATTLSALKRSVQERRRFTPGIKDTHYGAHPSDGQACLDVYVTRENFERAMRFMDTLLKTFQACGFETHLVRDGYSRSLRVEVLRERFRLRLCELTEKVPHTPTPEDFERHEKYGTRIPKTHREPSGELSLSLCGDEINHEIRAWSDGAVRKVEDMIPDIIRGILQRVEETRERRRAEAIEARRRADEAQRRYEQEQRRRDEQARVDSMLQEVDAWERARRIRRYLRALERTVLEHRGPIHEGSELDTWLDWAHAVADRFDPTTPYARKQKPAPEAEAAVPQPSS